jgi:hypothetical protein
MPGHGRPWHNMRTYSLLSEINYWYKQGLRPKYQLFMKEVQDHV